MQLPNKLFPGMAQGLFPVPLALVSKILTVYFIAFFFFLAAIIFFLYLLLVLNVEPFSFINSFTCPLPSNTINIHLCLFTIFMISCFTCKSLCHLEFSLMLARTGLQINFMARFSCVGFLSMTQFSELHKSFKVKNRKAKLYLSQLLISVPLLLSQRLWHPLHFSREKLWMFAQEES